MAGRPFTDPAVKAVFDGCAPDVRYGLLRLRALIFEAADKDPRVGEIVETLKWGPPAYLPGRPRTGSTVRIAPVRNDPGAFAMYLHCQTSLVDTFRQLYPDDLAFSGNRAVIFRSGDDIPDDAVMHCAGLALSYHLER